MTALDVFDHFFDHVAADVTGLARGQIAIVTLLQVYADLVCNLVLHVIHLLARCV